MSKLHVPAHKRGGCSDELVLLLTFVMCECCSPNYSNSMLKGLNHKYEHPLLVVITWLLDVCM